MFRTNWKNWACAAIVSAALVPAVSFARTKHQNKSEDKQPQKHVVTKTTTHAKSASPSKHTLTTKKPTSHKLTARKHTPAKLVKKPTHSVTLSKKPPHNAKQLSSKKTPSHSVKLTQRKKVALHAKGKIVKA
ncbi:MAG TPA: hypothetical protein VL282_12095 [Tepidisphaeraceae bacterium]|jgi:hypothetical protein|nr:hypothetical protein [Tepidisphaeraceae bacterium]